MKKNLHKTLKPFLEIAALVVLATDVLLAAGTIWFSSRVRVERELHGSVQAQVAVQQATVKRLEETKARLPGTEGQIKLFLESHVPSRREGFARATRLVWLLKQKCGVQLDGVGYKPDRTQDEPLRRLALEVTLEGPFFNLIEFAHSLETASDFVVLRAFNFTPGEGGKLGLHLSADFYVVP